MSMVKDEKGNKQKTTIKRDEIKKVLAKNLLDLVKDNYLILDFATSISVSTLNNYKNSGTTPNTRKLMALLPAIEHAYTTYEHEVNKTRTDYLNSWLTDLNDALIKAGVTVESKEEHYIESEDNLGKVIIPYCLNLLNNANLTVPYLYKYRPQHLKKLPFPPHLSPSLMKELLIIGREKECQEIHQLVIENEEPIYLHSIAGLGKTSVVYDYVRRYKTRRDLLINIPSGSDDVRYDVLNELAPEQLDKFSDEKVTDHHLTNALYNFTEKMKEYDPLVLLVIDNISSPKQLSSIEKLRPLIDIGWKILVTTRKFTDVIKKRFIYTIQPLTEENALRLFEYYYFDDSNEDALSKAEREDLLQLFIDIDFHTFLIKLLAKVGNRCKISISELIAHVAKTETDVLWSSDFLDSQIFDENEQEYRKIRSIILALFDLSNLNPLEKYVLGCFTLVPDVPIDENDLIKWIANTDDLKPLPLKNILINLCQQGWLLPEENNGKKYKCHILVQGALSLDVETTEKINYLPFIQNITRYLNFPYDGVERTDIFQNLAILANVLAKYKDETKERYQLIKQYLSCRIYFSYCTEDCLNYIKEMMYLFEKFYSKDSEDYHLEKLICQYIYTETYFEVSDEKGKTSKTMELRRQTVRDAEKLYDKKPLLCIRINQLYASSLNREGHFEEATTLLNTLQRKIEFTLLQEKLENEKEWKYALFRNYELLGIVGNAQHREEHPNSSISLKDVLATRKKYLEIGKELLTEDSYKLRSCYNDLGMTYLFIYDEKKDEKEKEVLLDRAEYYLTLSYNMAIDRYGKDSIKCISPIKNFASLLKRKADFDEAKTMTKHAYQLRKGKPNGEFTRELMVDARFLGLIYLDEFRYQTKKDPSLLDEALKYSKEALAISEYLHDGVENRDSKRNKKRIKDIKKEIDKLDDSEK